VALATMASSAASPSKPRMPFIQASAMTGTA
jgi:hypothetical protein